MRWIHALLFCRRGHLWQRADEFNLEGRVCTRCGTWQDREA